MKWIVVLVVLVPLVAGGEIDLSVTPTTLDFSDLVVGSTSVTSVVVSVNTSEPLVMRFNTSALAVPWVQEVEVTDSYSERIPITIHVPDESGEYSTVLFISFTPIEGEISAVLEFPVKIFVHATREGKVDLLVRTPDVKADGSVLTVGLNVTNRGSSLGMLTGKVVVTDIRREEVLDSFPVELGEIDSGENVLDDIEVGHSLEPGDYVAQIDLGGEEKEVSFNVPKRFPWVILLTGIIFALFLLSRRAGFFLFSLLLMPLAFGAVPSMDSVMVSDTVYLSESVAVPVTCNGTFSDLDGYGDVILGKGILYDNRSYSGSVDNNVRYDDASCGLSGSGTTGYVNCSFDVWYYANASDWVCNLTVFDATASDSLEDGFVIPSLLALSVLGFSYDNGSGGAIGLGDVSGISGLTITNSGNTDLGVEVSGSGLTCDSGSVPVSYQRYSTESGFSYGDGVNLTGSAVSVGGFTVPRRIDDASPSTGALYWRLRMPVSAVGGECSGTISIDAV